MPQNFHIRSPLLKPRLIGVLIAILAGTTFADVPLFLDTFDGPDLHDDWTLINPGSYAEFDGSGYYEMDGVFSASTELRRGMGGQGSFIAEIDLELGPFFLGGSGGTKSDFKFRFSGSGGNVEIVLNSYRSLRVSSPQLGGDLAPPVTLSALADNDRLDLQLAFLDTNGSLDVKVAINGGAWQDVASGAGITGFLGGNSEISLFKFGSSPTTVPQMRLDRYEIRANPAADLAPIASPDVYQTPHETVLMVPASGVLTNDTHPLGLPLTAALVSNAPLGTVHLDPDGAFTYQPLPGHTGQTRFTYRATDGSLDTAETDVLIEVSPPSPEVVELQVLSAEEGDYRIEWESAFEKTYSLLGTTDLEQDWYTVASNLPAALPTTEYPLDNRPHAFEAFRVQEESAPVAWPHTDYCALMSQEVLDRKPGFLAGNLVYYIGGEHGWNQPTSETIGLTHAFFHDLRSRGHGMVTNAATGYGHDLTGWEFWKDTRIATGTVIIDGTEYPNPVPTRMAWRPDRMICEYAVGGVPIREDKFISTNDVACSFIKSGVPIQIRFSGQSFVRDGRSIQRTSTLRYDGTNNMVHVVEGGTILVKPVEGVEEEGRLMYDGMSTVVSASEDLSTSYSGFRDGDGRQQYSFTVPCDAQGVSVCWAMDDVYENARDRVQSVLDDPDGHLAAKKAHMNELLNLQIPYFRCSDQQIVDIYYYLWALQLMYYIDVGDGWEQYPHTQSAVNNFLGMHRYDAAFQIRVGAWTTDKPAYAYGNVLIWSALLPFVGPLGSLPDNMGTTWHSGIYGATTDHANGAWEIYERSGDTNFLADCYEPYFKPLFWNGITEHWGYMFNAADKLARMAEVVGQPADAQHWHNLVNMSNINNWLNARWESDTPHWFLSGNPMNWGAMAYMGMEQFPDEWAREMTEHWAVNDTQGFFATVPLSTRALKDWDGVSPVFTITPDTNWWAIRGMYLHHVGINANRCALGHLKGYNLEWGIPVAPEALDINFDPWGDQYSNFNAGKLLLILEGMTGVDYSIPDGTFTVADHMPGEWTFMELKVPVTQPGQTNWVDVRIDRTEGTGGVIDKTISVSGNPLPLLEIQPWLEEKTLVSAPPGDIDAPTNHVAYAFTNTPGHTLAIRFQD